ncbi:chromosome segregation protein SMC [Saccharopolyspora erythraea]|uniref:chromosome segregation protein SMC n=1 Tax=Saccharopolyspora erythraea TaxID=1836 RepID=UPI001BABE5A9|nr:chromosome segregation protein SMC [Saccharopolyspora erythraea]QUH04519.1 chromosome segregation protein SMC [Saccharopolyspora erythraea]
MHLKSLTLKGFKSFASATTLRFEPGITCVVGPNGSGKSNVLDALRWVMGEQGAKDLRGGKMEDVIFAGTAGRAPLGRAEVTLTIDNSDGALPIEYTEVSITRRMFRDGASEYEINGNSCRLMDVQELLSDSGIGREMHVIVGQGQLANILQAKPDEHRRLIEEAAGVLKHRKRKEKALRKLDAMQANLTRLTDLTSELRRQLKPLGKQAEIARKAQTVQADLRDARLRLIADDLVNARAELARDEADQETAKAKRAEVERALQFAQSEEKTLEENLAADAPRLTRAQETWYRLSALEERLHGTLRLAAERHRHLTAQTAEQRTGRDPEQLEAEAEEAAEQEIELREEMERAREVLSEVVRRRSELESSLKAAEQAHMAAVRAIADRREGAARLAGQVESMRSKAGATADEIERLSTSLAEAEERAEVAERAVADAEEESDGYDSDDAGLEDRRATAAEARDAARARVEELVRAERATEREIASWKARVEALSMGLRRKDGAGALLAAGDRVPGLLGSVAALLTVEPGAEAALAAALGAVADAVAVSGVGDAVAALELLRSDDAGQAGVLVGGSTVEGDRSAWPALDGSARWAVDLVRAPDGLQPAVTAVLDRMAVVDDLATARELVGRHPEVRAVTSTGDVLGGHWATGGSADGQSVIEVQAAVDEAESELAAAERRLEQHAAALEGARAEEEARRDEVRAIKDQINEAKVRRARSTERLSSLQKAARSATGEVERVRVQRTNVERSREDALVKLADLEERLAAVKSEQEEQAEPDTGERDRLNAELTAVRQEEMDARLGQRTAEERARAVQGRADQLRRAARHEREARARAEAARRARERGARVAKAVVEGSETALERIAASLRSATQERDTAQAQQSEHEQALGAVRARVRELSGELEKLVDAVHRDEVVRAEQRLRIEQLEVKIIEDFGIGLDDLVDEYGPTVPVPPSPAEIAEYEAAKERGEQVSEPPPVPFDRSTQERRAKRAEKDLSLLGKVNPLALEEFAALEERYKFLSTQLEDLKATRRDLLDVVKEVDEKILEVFSSAFHDVAAEFEKVFTVLFPGGAGKLVLTEPDDLLTTGVEVEARPPGKKVKRLSLLSGGEKSLTAVAMLVSIFRARPSPFYVLDEVEAALDDTNLRRLITLLDLLRETSQLIIITHQKPTMEIADALYGVTMRGDGITTVISQRLRAGKAGKSSAPAGGESDDAAEAAPATAVESPSADAEESDSAAEESDVTAAESDGTADVAAAESDGPADVAAVESDGTAAESDAGPAESSEPGELGAAPADPLR